MKLRSKHYILAGLGLVAVAAVILFAGQRYVRDRFEARLQSEIARVASEHAEAQNKAAAEAARATAEAAEAAERAADLERAEAARLAALAAPARLVGLSITPERARLVAEALPGFDPNAEVEVPFTRFETASHTARFLIVPARVRSTLDISGIGRVSFDRDGVPLKMVEFGRGRVVAFFREAFSGHLYLYRIGADGSIAHALRIRGPQDSEPILREAIAHDGRLITILYDNERGLNEVFALDWQTSADEVLPEPVAALPTLEDPAGTHYEMMPTLYMLPAGQQLWIVGGTLVARLGDDGLAEQHRLEPCERAQEAVAGKDGPVVLCLLKAGGKDRFALSRWRSGGRQGEYAQLPGDTVPFGLRLVDGRPETDTPESTRDISRILRRDLSHGHVSGVMELGSNNIEGRIAWSQIYTLNGLLDIVKMAATDNDAFIRLGPLAADAKRRLDIEIQIIDKLMATPTGYTTEAFTMGREPALFAVQTARLLLLFNRYAREIPSGVALTSHDALRRNVLTFAGHIDEMRVAGEGVKAPKPGRHFLAWPKGSAFYFDGLNVPFNHQNEWAYSVLDTLKDRAGDELVQKRTTPAVEIINHFLESVAPDGKFPADGEWPYWWGQAWDGWSAEADISVNMPTYAGDKSVAFISFRSIDLMSTMAARHASYPASSQSLLESMQRAVARGHVYPFVASSFVEDGYRPALDPDVAIHYLRQTAPWELQSAVWAALDVPVANEPEDPHSHLLNAKVLAAHPKITQARPDGPHGPQALADYLSIAIPYNVQLAVRHTRLELGGKILSWNLAYDLDAAAAAFERTRDERFAKLLEAGLDAAMSMRDDRLGLRDEIRNLVMPAWGTNRYSPDKEKWMAWDAFTGIITHPAVVYADLARRFGDATMKRKGETYLADSIKALAAFDPWWREDLESGAGWYFDPLYLDVAPLNHMNLLGLTHIELCKRFGRADSCRKAEGLARFFKASLKRNDDGSCAWEYWAGAQLDKHRSESGEDVTHAHINVRFAHLAWTNGIVFDRADIECIGKSLTERIMRPEGDWAMAVDGAANLIESKLHEGLSAWMVLEDVAPGAAKRIDEFMLARPDAYPLGLLSYATGPASFARRLPLADVASPEDKAVVPTATGTNSAPTGAP